MFTVLAVGVALAADPGVGLDFVAPVAIKIPVSTLGPAPAKVPVHGPFRLAGVAEGVRTYEAPNPVRPRALFYERQPLEMELYRGARRLAYDADPLDRDMAGGWEANGSSVMVRVRPDTARPDDSTYILEYPPATEREEALRFRGGDASAWAVRSAQVDDVTRHGVLLPTGSEASWKLVIPAGAHLVGSLAILPREIADTAEASDGATLEVRVDGAPVAAIRAGLGPFVPVDLALPGDGASHTLSLHTVDETPAFDNVFLASPTVRAAPETPRQLVLAFVDTLRRDHLGTYGYARDAAPKLGKWAENAVVFDDARSVAPWTLPSTRALWTGRQPEAWDEAQTLQEALRARGWATGAVLGNVYLSSNFGMDRGWGEHACLNVPPAAYEAFRARKFLKQHAAEDTLLLVHFMDLHLPYQEPSKYRHIWAKADPNGLDKLFSRTILMRVAEHQRELIRPYLIDRYDQNLRYVDDELSSFLGSLSPQATVVLFADHGEEFFDHGDVEHGHTLFDELLRVPLVIRAPGLAPRRVPEPVTLMDVAPTLLELLGLPADTLGAVEGRSLVPIARGASDASFASRAVALGRVLYGGAAWGSLRDHQKYISTKGRESLFDLEKDPGEAHDLAAEGADVSPGRLALADGTGRQVVQALRVIPSARSNKELLIDVQVPGGVSAAWVGDDPTANTIAEIRSIEGEFVHLAFESKLKEHREVFLVPNRAVEEVVGEVSLRILGRMSLFQHLESRPNDGSGRALGQIRSGSASVSVTYAVLPLPGGTPLVGADGELSGALEALGYAEPVRGNDDEAESDDGASPKPPSSD